LLSILQGVDSVFETDLFNPLLDAASSATGLVASRDLEVDVSLRILADHARSTAMLISDGVFPSNEDRGYVLRRLIRRAVRRAYSVGVERQVMASVAASVITEMGGAYPDLERNRDFILQVLDVEEGRFRSTLQKGLVRLNRYVSDDLGLGDTVVQEGGVGVDGDQSDRPGFTPASQVVPLGVAPGEPRSQLPGAVAFELHDTYGFPIEVTREVVAERGVEVDEEGFRALMADQRVRARAAARRDGGTGPNADAYRDLLDGFGPSAFVGEHDDEATARVLAVLPDSGGREGQVEIVLDRTPFYAEGGGQVGDTGHLRSETGMARVVDTTRGLPGLTRHHAVVEEGTVVPGQEVAARLDGARRDMIRRNHTGTHLLHWALGQVLGPHVKQQGSLVGPHELRFDFSHFSAMAPDEIARVEALVNADVLDADPVVVREMSMAEAEAEGAVAFFGEKYGEVVRVLDAGPHSRELCGGTHVRNTGQIGPLRIVREESIASNTRRIYATTGTGTLERRRQEEETLRRAAALLKAKPEGIPEAIERVLTERRTLQDELQALRAKEATADAASLVVEAAHGVVVARRDGTSPEDLRLLALAVRDRLEGPRGVVLIGTPDGQRVALVAAVAPGASASALLAEPAALVGGRGGGRGDVAQAGGRDPAGIDAALERARALL
ncbi:MAG: alanine--tRNA ligase-related protein, partial [Acidimicrobiales bacterium]